MRGETVGAGRVLDGSRVRATVNRLWVAVNAAVIHLVGGGPRTSLFDPAFLHWHYFTKNLTWASRYATGTLVDLGCGTKPFARFFAVERYFGLDVPFFSGGIETTPATPDLYGNACVLPLCSQSVQTVAAFQILEHVTQPAALLREAVRVLVDGGVLVLTCPQAYPIHGHPHDYYRYTSNGLRYLLEEAGCEVVRLERNGSFGAYLGLMINVYLFYHFFETRKRYAAKVALGALKILLMPALLVVICLVNLAGWSWNLCDDNEYFTSNYTVVARKLAR